MESIQKWSHNLPVVKKAASERMTKYHQNCSEDAKLKRSAAISAGMKKIAKTNPDIILRRNASIKEGVRSYLEELQDRPDLYVQWMESHGKEVWASGKVIDVNYGKYCEKWKDVNPRVHAFFEYKCVECGAPENGRSHAGHHIFYVKEACCLSNKDGEYYTNLDCKKHPENDYYIGDNPNYFVILCPKCHGKTNGKFENRKKWADHFKKLIDTKYNGKCYFTKEEMATITKGSS